MEELKDKPAFSKIKQAHCQASGRIPDLAQAEWKSVHTADDARKWHIKWTPWFNLDQIEGFIKYAYPEQINNKK